MTDRTFKRVFRVSAEKDAEINRTIAAEWERGGVLVELIYPAGFAGWAVLVFSYPEIDS